MESDEFWATLSEAQAKHLEALDLVPQSEFVDCEHAAAGALLCATFDNDPYDILHTAERALEILLDTGGDTLDEEVSGGANYSLFAVRGALLMLAETFPRYKDVSLDHARAVVSQQMLEDALDDEEDG